MIEQADQDRLSIYRAAQKTDLWRACLKNLQVENVAKIPSGVRDVDVDFLKDSSGNKRVRVYGAGVNKYSFEVVRLMKGMVAGVFRPDGRVEFSYPHSNGVTCTNFEVCLDDLQTLWDMCGNNLELPKSSLKLVLVENNCIGFELIKTSE